MPHPIRSDKYVWRGVLLAALAEGLGDVGTGHNAARGLVELLARLPAAARVAVGVQQTLKLLRYVHRIYDTRERDV
jgi:hypothetical protein